MDVPEDVEGEEPDPSRQDKNRHPAVIDSESILQGQREVWIRHGGELYRLRLTSSGGLYLTK